VQPLVAAWTVDPRSGQIFVQPRGYCVVHVLQGFRRNGPVLIGTRPGAAADFQPHLIEQIAQHLAQVMRYARPVFAQCFRLAGADRLAQIVDIHSQAREPLADSLHLSIHMNRRRSLLEAEAHVLEYLNLSRLHLRPPVEIGEPPPIDHAVAQLGAFGKVARNLVHPQPRVKAELELALAWVRHQVKVLGEWGFEQRAPFGYGLSTLFSGPSGTGKTMAAQVLAKQLDLDLYRVDLSRVVSKYIGETEKNLGQLFDESHRSGAILFFDEADALFGKRSEVKDAHDRYANVEIGYLLQCMEEHDGIVILATNRKQDMDEAFTRRFDIIASFPMPDETHRLRIWEGMFPHAAARDEALDCGPLARKFELSGGEIRNVVLAAAYLVANDSQPIAMRHLKQALMREQRKSGRVIDEKEFDAL